MTVVTSDSVISNRQYKAFNNCNESIQQSFYYPLDRHGISVKCEGNVTMGRIPDGIIEDITAYMEKHFPSNTKLIINADNKTIIFKSEESTEKAYGDLYDAYHKFCIDDNGLASLKNGRIILRNYSIGVE